MFSLLSLRNIARSAFILLVILCLSLALFTGCKDDPDPNPIPVDPVTPTTPVALQGNWVSLYGEAYIITDTTYSTFSDPNYGDGYSGTFVNHRSASSSAGYITIKYTKHYDDPAAIGKYYVVYYENLTASTFSISGAYNADDLDFNYPKGGGKATQAEAESTYTVENNYFGWGSDCEKISSQTFPNKLQGTWANTQSGNPKFVVTNKFVLYSGSNYYSLMASIEKVVDNGETGYFVIRVCAYPQTGNTNAAIGNYTVLHWTDYTATSGSFSIGGVNATWSGIPASQIDMTSIEAAEGKYITADPAFTFNRRTFTKQ
jgi:hypothetical protein